MRASSLYAVLVGFIAAATIVSAVGDGKSRGAPAKTETEARVEGPFENQNLALYVVRGKATDDRQYITLGDGLRAGSVVVRERGAGGGGDRAAVNELEVENKSDRWVFLQAGDVVEGGKQDRTIGIDIAIPPKSAPQSISAFCVEHGRWTAKAGGGLAFQGSAAMVSSPRLKKSIQGEKNQSAVWAEVARGEVRAAEVVSADPAAPLRLSSTGTWSAIAQNREIRAKTADYVKPLLPRVEAAADAIGLVVAINGELVAADVYGSADLFHRLAAKLVESYAREALLARNSGKTHKAPSREAAADFLSGVSRADGKDEAVAPSVRRTTRESSRAVLYEYTEASDSDGSRRLLHKNLVTK